MQDSRAMMHEDSGGHSTRSGMVTIKVRTLERGINITARTLVREAVEKELENLGVLIPTTLNV